MQRKLVVEFTKMNGAGNDFIVIDNRFYYFSEDELARLAQRYCARGTGIGADGLLAFNPAADAGHHFRMHYRNADGSLGTMCGNGARCLARFARQAGVDVEAMRFETDAGVYRAHVPADPQAPVRLFVPPPERFAADVAVDGERAHFIWTGTEHLVCMVQDVAAVDVATRGPVLRHDPALKPRGANVNFVEVADASGDRPVLRVRTFEKGVEAETLACGTGAMASGVVSRLLGHIDTDTVDVAMPGGTLTVGFDVDGGSVRNLYLEGPADTVYRGTLEI